MRYDEVMDHNAAQRKAGVRRGDPKIDHLRVSEAENSGHVVEHHYENSGPGVYKEPKTHVFGPHDGPKPKLPEGHVLHHIAKHMAIPHEVIKASETHGKQSQNPEMEEPEGEE